MKGDIARVVAEARALWRADRSLVTAVSAPFVFLPQWALLMLVPPPPAVDAGLTTDALGKALEPWIASYGIWYVVATLLTQYGTLALVSLYMPPVPAAGSAMARAGWRLPRALLAGLLVAFPCAAVALVSLSVPFLSMLVVPAIIYVLARATLSGPVILAETGTGAVAAVVRSFRLTAGRGLAVALLVGAITLGGQATGAILVSVERTLRGGALANPALIAAIDAGAAGITWAAAVALALVQVVLYRRLAR